MRFRRCCFPVSGSSGHDAGTGHHPGGLLGSFTSPVAGSIVGARLAFGSETNAPFGSSHSNVSFSRTTDSTSPSSYVTTCSPVLASNAVTIPRKYAFSSGQKTRTRRSSASSPGCFAATCGGRREPDAFVPFSFFVRRAETLGCSGASVTVRSRATSSGSPRGTYSVMASSCARVAVRSTSNFLSTYPSRRRRSRSFSRRASRFASDARSASPRRGEGGMSTASFSHGLSRVRSRWFASSSPSPIAGTAFSKTEGGGDTSSRPFAFGDAGDASTVDTLSTRSGIEPSPFFAARSSPRAFSSRSASISASDRPAGRHASHPEVFVTVFDAHAQVLLTTHRRARNRRRSALEAFRVGVPSRESSSSRKRSSSSSSSSSPGPASRIASIRNRSGRSSIGPGVSGCHRVSGARTLCANALCLSFSFFLEDSLEASAPGPPPLPRATSTPTSSSHWPILSPTGLSEHTTATLVRQFLLFSIPQWRSNAVVVITFPSAIPLRDAQFSRAESHMHRNAARRVRNTPATPPQRTGTAAAGSPRGNGGGIVRGAPSFRFGSSCASSSSAHIASAAKPDTSPRGRSSFMPASARRRRACSSVSPAAMGARRGARGAAET